MDCKIVSLQHVLCLGEVLQITLHFLKLFVLCLMKKPGARVLYLGAASGTTVSHVSDVVGPVSKI